MKTKTFCLVMGAINVLIIINCMIFVYSSTNGIQKIVLVFFAALSAYLMGGKLKIIREMDDD